MPFLISTAFDQFIELRRRLRRAKDLAYDAWRAAHNDDNATAMAKLRTLLGDRFHPTEIEFVNNQP